MRNRADVSGRLKKVLNLKKCTNFKPSPLCDLQLLLASLYTKLRWIVHSIDLDLLSIASELSLFSTPSH